MMGGDPDAVSISNFIKHFNPKLLGPSTSTQPLVSVAGAVSYTTCRNALSTRWYGICSHDLVDYPLADNLNAAISGAMAVNLDVELNYLMQGIHYIIVK